MGMGAWISMDLRGCGKCTKIYYFGKLKNREVCRADREGGRGSAGVY